MDLLTPLHLVVFLVTALAQSATSFVLALLAPFNPMWIDVPQLTYQPTAANRALWAGMQDLLRRFTPAPWGLWGKAQTLLGNLGAKARHPYTRSEVVRLDDDVLVLLDWKEPAGGSAALPLDAPVLVVCPGIAGSSTSGAAISITDAAMDRGWRSVVFNRRGHGGASLLPAIRDVRAAMRAAAFRPYPEHADLDDMHRVVSHVQSTHPAAPMLLVGVSAGACLAVKYLGDRAAAAPFIAAVSLSNGHELVPLTRWLASDRQSGALMLTALRQLLLANANDVQAIVQERSSLSNARSRLMLRRLLHTPMDVRSFEAALLPMRPVPHDDVDAYYERNSCHHALHAVRVPLLTLAALDDPLIPPQLHGHAQDAARMNPNVFSVVTRRGGHLGWLTGVVRPRSWATDVMMRFLELQVARATVTMTTRPVP